MNTKKIYFFIVHFHSSLAHLQWCQTQIRHGYITQKSQHGHKAQQQISKTAFPGGFLLSFFFKQ